MDEAVSEDTLLDGRVRLLQPVEGYRVAIDPVLLAASVPVQPGDRVLDIGAGVGAAAICLAAREPGCRIVGLEIDRLLVRLAGQNAILNGFGPRIEMVVGDILHPPPRLAPSSYHHVMVNPPHIEAERGSPPEHAARAAAHIEGEARLSDWVRLALSMVRPKGTVTFIHRADRLDALLAELSQRIGELVVFPLWPGPAKPAKRIIVRGRKDVGTPTRLAPGLVMHAADGAYTTAAEAVLRHGASLAL